MYFEILDKYILKSETNTFWNLRQIHCEMLDFAGSGASQVRTYCGSQPRIWGASKESYTFLSSTNPLRLEKNICGFLQLGRVRSCLLCFSYRPFLLGLTSVRSPEPISKIYSLSVEITSETLGNFFSRYRQQSTSCCFYSLLGRGGQL